MDLVLLNASDGSRINEVGSGSRISNLDLPQFTLQAIPGSQVEGQVGSVEFTINDNKTIVRDAPFTLTNSTEGVNAFEPAELAAGTYSATVKFFIGDNADGQVLSSETITFDVVGDPSVNAGGEAPKGQDLTEDDRSEFNTQGEAEAEAETEAEAEVNDQIAGGATASGAVASAFGANAVSQTLASGSVSLGNISGDFIYTVQPSDSEGPSGSGSRPVGGDGPLSGGGNVSNTVTIISAEAEAEAETEAEAEAEVGDGVASAVAGISSAVGAVGTDVFKTSTTSETAALETATAVSGGSSTSTSVDDVSYDASLRVPFGPGVPDQAEGMPAAEENTGPSSAELQAGIPDENATQLDTEVEVEIEAEAEAETETGEGVAAAAVAGGTGVAVAGNFASADSSTSVGTATSTSEVTGEISGLLNLTDGFLAPELLQGGQPKFGPTATVLNFDNNTSRPIGETPPADTIPATDTTSDVITGTGLFEAEAEAESEVEVEIDVDNGAAAVAVVATGGAGATAINSSTLSSSSTAGVAATLDSEMLLQRANDIVESTSFRAADGTPISEPGTVAEAEAEVEANAVVNLSAPAIFVRSDGDGLGDAVSASGVSVGGILTGRTAEVSTGVNEISMRDAVESTTTRPRENVEGEAGVIALPTGNLEVENEAEAEAEAEAEVGFNSAAAGAGANAVAAQNAFVGSTANATTATSTSVSVRENGEQVFDDFDRPGPEPLGDTGNIVLPSTSLGGILFEVETEAEAEAEVGFNAGATAAAAGAAGYEGISAVIDQSATINSAASAAAAGAYTEIAISAPEEGMAGFVTASARAWDPEGRGVSVAVAVAGMPSMNGADNEAEREAEGRFEAFVEVSIYTEAYSVDMLSLMFDAVAMEGGEAEDGEPEGFDSRLESESEVEAEAEAEAGYGVAAASAATAVAGFGGVAVADTETATGAFSDAFIGELLQGTESSDELVGSAGVDILIGGGGSDNLSGGDLSDRIDGGSGNDNISGDAGFDVLFGGSGDDTINGGDGNDRIVGGIGENMLSGGNGNDNVFGGAEADMLVGGDGNDNLRGGKGNDMFIGGLGADTLVGGEGEDVLSGGAQSDLIFGGDAFDFVNGGFGSDRINGGNGGDTFFHAGVAGHGSDWIQDFDSSEGDKLFFGLAGDADDFQVNFGNKGAAGTASVDEAFIIYQETGQVLFALVDGADQNSIMMSTASGETFDLLA